MPLDTEARVDLLERVLAIESRSFIEYLAKTAPPYDIDQFPEVAAALEFIIRDEDAIIEDLVTLIDQEGATADVRAAFDSRLSSYNYLATSYTLRVTRDQLTKNLAVLDRVLAEAEEGAPDIAAKLRDIRAHKQQHLATIEGLLAKIAGSGSVAGKPAARAEPPAS